MKEEEKKMHVSQVQNEQRKLAAFEISSFNV